jgi:hypothetical protein
MMMMNTYENKQLISTMEILLYYWIKMNIKMKVCKASNNLYVRFNAFCTI